MFLIDTNVISELRRTRPHGAVLAWKATVPNESLFVSAVTIGELQLGIEKTRKHDALRGSLLEDWLERIVATFRVLPMNSSEYRLWAKLMQGRSVDLYEDGMIAATALVHQLTVATRNVSDFEAFQVPIVNPFDFGPGTNVQGPPTP